MKVIIVLATLFVLAATVIPALEDGKRRFRWGDDAETRELAARLDRFPMQIGEWEAVSDYELLTSVANMLQPIAAINRVYFNRSAQVSANVFILFGPTGPTAVHTPDVCFNSREFKFKGQRRVVNVDPSEKNKSQCFVSSFESRAANQHGLRSWYAWTRDGTWHAPAQPRFYFADGRYLFKIQIAVEFPSREAMENDELIQDFVLELEKTLREQVF